MSQINDISDIANNPNANLSSDAADLAGAAVPGVGGLALGALGSLLPGGWLDSVLGLGSFSNSVAPPPGGSLTLPGSTTPSTGLGLDPINNPDQTITFNPDVGGISPGTGFWGDVQNAFNSFGQSVKGLLSSGS